MFAFKVTELDADDVTELKDEIETSVLCFWFVFFHVLMQFSLICQMRVFSCFLSKVLSGG